jgi:hypothetical protein
VVASMFVEEILSAVDRFGIPRRHVAVWSATT